MSQPPAATPINWGKSLVCDTDPHRLPAFEPRTGLLSPPRGMKAAPLPRDLHQVARRVVSFQSLEETLRDPVFFRTRS